MVDLYEHSTVDPYVQGIVDPCGKADYMNKGWLIHVGKLKYEQGIVDPYGEVDLLSKGWLIHMGKLTYMGKGWLMFLSKI